MDIGEQTGILVQGLPGGGPGERPYRASVRRCC